MTARISLPVVRPRSNGAIIYRGPSMLDGQPIVVIAIGLRSGSENGKTGDLVQTYILADGTRPVDALMNGADVSVCGDCSARVVDGAGYCYVNVGQGPTAVYDAYARDSYPTVADADGIAELGRGRQVRLGTYGDPVAVPVHIWHSLIAHADSHAGYTHQWRRAAAQAYRSIVMASADTPEEGIRARAKGWRTFRVRLASESVHSHEIVCPASEEAGKVRTCETCMACDGAGTNAGRRSIVIIAHGLAWKVQRYTAMRRARAQKKRYRHRQLASR